MTFKERTLRILQSDSIVAFFLLCVFLLTKGYRYGWDDQHVEIPLLKSLIDNTLYQGDYYVESLKANFTSYLYPILARLITVEQIPATYFTLYIITKYFLLFWAYKLWKAISGEKTVAFFCVAVFILMGRVPEFLYRTFSHQEFALAIIMAAFYFFYQSRYIAALVTLGIASNFHFLYSLIPMVYFVTYLMLRVKDLGWKFLLKSLFTLLLFSSPILIWLIKKNLPSYLGPPVESPIDWVSLAKIACPQNFIFFGIGFKNMFTHFEIWWDVVAPYVLLVALYLLNVLYNEKFKKEPKNHTIALAAVAMFTLTYIFTILMPNRFVLDLNLVRNSQFLLFLFMGFTVILVFQIFDKESPRVSFFASISFGFLALPDSIAILSVLFLSLFLAFRAAKAIQQKFLKNISQAACLASMAACSVAIYKLILKSDTPGHQVALAIIVLAILSYVLRRYTPWATHIFIKRAFLILPLIALFLFLADYYVKRVRLEETGGGFWKLQRDWEDMQGYVKNHTPKDAMLLVPHDMEMGGFRIGSERKIVCCYRDCGVFGFSFTAAVEWVKRLATIEPFKVVIDNENQSESINSAIVNAIMIYKANYIVFMRYYAPEGRLNRYFKKLYENDSFSLFKVILNPPAAIN